MTSAAAASVVPFRRKLPALGGCSRTDAKPWPSPGASLKPKSARASAKLPLVGRASVASLPRGASFTASTLIATLSVSVKPTPSRLVSTRVSAPTWLALPR